MKTTWQTSQVKHEPEKSRFALQLDAENVALLEYSKRETATTVHYTLYHTETPPKYSGQGIAALVVGTALKLLVASETPQSNVVIVPTCSYVRHFAQKLPDDDPIKLHVEL